MTDTRCSGRAVQQRHELALQASRAGTWHWDPVTRALDADDALWPILGVAEPPSADGLAAWVAALDPRDRGDMAEVLSNVLDRGESHHLVYRVAAGDGTVRWIDHRAEPLHDADGGYAGMAGLCRDMTARETETGLVAAEHRWRQRVEFLAEASSVLGRSLDAEQTLEELAGLAVPWLADWCTIDRLDEHGLRPAATAHRDPAKAALLREARQRAGCADHGAGSVIHADEPHLIEEVSDQLLASLAEDEEHLARLRELRPASAVVVPLRASTRPLGAMTLVQAESGRCFRREDIELAQDLAGRAAVAVDNALAYAERDRVAQMLQQALLPPELPDLPRVDLATSYDSADETIGGDFYDIVPAAEGWMVVVGDVCGKGVNAASLTALARHTIRGAALQVADPQHVLRVLNDAVARHGAESFCTAVCAHLVVGCHQARMTVASGGHPPVLVRRAGGAVEQVDCDGMVIGLLDEPDLGRAHLTLEPGDLALFYTDGLTEARRGQELFGVEGVASALRGTVPDADAALAKVHEAAEGWQEHQADDVAMLAARVDLRAGGGAGRGTGVAERRSHLSARPRTAP
jgi:serine phosphatase RsbU (regulator of sigma subunit)